MPQTLACFRCGRLVPLAVFDASGDNVYEEDPETYVAMDDSMAMITTICGDCLTKNEVLDNARQAAAVALDNIEQLKAHIELMMERVKGPNNAALVKADYARVLEQEKHLREMFAFTMSPEYLEAYEEEDE